ncbi:hypothetical protein GCM10010317_008790 [Streptomyces mirabilis]|nr:hypothetical protein GCM10010317_008790 [Streptomyces mirabilis]
MGISPHGQKAGERLTMDLEAEGSAPGPAGLTHRATVANCGARTEDLVLDHREAFVESLAGIAAVCAVRGSAPARAARRLRGRRRRGRSPDSRARSSPG